MSDSKFSPVMDGSLPRILCYLLALALVTLLFIYIRFPHDELKHFVERSSRLGPVAVEIGDARLAFPLGLSLSNVTLSDPYVEKAGEIVAIEYLNFRPSILYAIVGKRFATFYADTLSGVASADVELAGDDYETTRLEFQMDELDPAEGMWWKNFPWARLSGIVDGEGEFTITGQDIRGGAGWLKALLSEGVLTFGPALVVAVPPVSIDSGVLEIDYKSARATIKKGEFAGKDAEAIVTGFVDVAKNPRFSRLNLKVNLKLSDSYRDKLGPLEMLLPQSQNGYMVFQIRGTFAHPGIG